jgi:hypothetical protein
MEFGRLLFIYVTTTSAAREATRYASAVEDIGGVERYRDCAGIRAAARNVDVLGAISSINVSYYTNYGGLGQIYRGNCPAEGGTGPHTGPILSLGDQVVVEVYGSFQPIVPMVPISINTLEAHSARTIIKEVPVDVLVPPLVPIVDPNLAPPWISFESYYSFSNESAGSVSIPVKMTDENGNSQTHTGDILITYRVSSLSEAIGGGVDYSTGTSFTIYAGNSSGTLLVTINDDNLYEYNERVIIYLEPSVDVGNIVWPSTHVLYIVDNDNPPTVQFQDPTSSVAENVSPPYKDIILTLSEVSGRSTFIPINVLYDTSTALYGFDYLPQTNTVTIPAGSTGGLFRVNIFDDSIPDEVDDYVDFEIGDPINALVGINNQHTLTIIDNDTSTVVCSDYTIHQVNVSQNPARFTLRNRGTGPIYITGLNITWQNPQELNWIDFGTNRIWPTSTPPYEANIAWDGLNLNRQLEGGTTTRDLLFNFADSSAYPLSLSISLDVSCPPLTWSR